MREGAGARGKRLAGRSSAGLRTIPQSPPSAGWAGWGPPGAGAIFPCQGLGRDFPQPTPPPCRLQPHKWCRNARQPRQRQRGVPATPGRGVGVNPPTSSSLKDLGAPSPGGEGGGPLGCPGTTSQHWGGVPGCQLQAHLSFPSSGPSMGWRGEQEGAQVPPPRVPDLGGSG